MISTGNGGCCKKSFIPNVTVASVTKTFILKGPQTVKLFLKHLVFYTVIKDNRCQLRAERYHCINIKILLHMM
jgi:hypothetical protein